MNLHRRRVSSTVMCAATLGAVAIVASAHHSHAMFQSDREISITGTVREFQFTNPHSWLIVVAKSDGQLWSFETQPPSTLARGGIRRSMLNPGDEITVVANPLRDGRNGGEISMVSKADGTVLSRAMFGRLGVTGGAGGSGGGGEAARGGE